MVRAALLVAATAGTAFAQTTVGGPVVGDTTWTMAGSPYIVAASIVVGNNATLTVDAGVEVRFGPATGIAVGSVAFGPGAFVVDGTSVSPVRFTSNVPFSTDPVVPAQRGDWNAIVYTDFAIDADFDKTSPGTYLSGSKLEHAIVEFGGGQGVAGSVAIESAAPLLRNITVRESASRGVDASLVGTNTIVIVGSTFETSGTPSLNGGGLSVTGGQNHAISGNTFQDCRASSGGGFYSNSTQGLLFSDNLAQRNIASGGGAFIQNASNATVDNNRFLMNGSTGINYGGAYVRGSGAEISDNLFDGNTASTWGGAYLEGASVTGDMIVNNTASSSRGGAEVRAPIVTGLLVDMNQTNTFGGLYVSQSGSVVSECVVTDNSANTGNGGGLYVANSNVQVLGCQVTGNSTGGSGGGVFIASAGALVSGTTIGSNSAVNDGAGVYAGSSGWRVTDSIIEDNVAGRNGGGVYVVAGATGGNLAGDAKNEVLNTIQGNTAALGPALYYGVPFAADGSNDLPAGYVCWGTNDFTEVQSVIFDFFDDSSRGIVGVFPLAPCDMECVADWNDDGSVNILDVIDFINNWNAQGAGSDFNDDGNVNILDVIAFITEWNAGCP